MCALSQRRRRGGAVTTHALASRRSRRALAGTSEPAAIPPTGSAPVPCTTSLDGGASASAARRVPFASESLDIRLFTRLPYVMPFLSRFTRASHVRATLVLLSTAAVACAGAP